MYPGTVDWMQKETVALAPSTVKTKIIASPEAEVLRLDWGLHSGQPVHIPADVDQ